MQWKVVHYAVKSSTLCSGRLCSEEWQTMQQRKLAVAWYWSTAWFFVAFLAIIFSQWKPHWGSIVCSSLWSEDVRERTSAYSTVRAPCQTAAFRIAVRMVWDGVRWHRKTLCFYDPLFWIIVRHAAVLAYPGPMSCNFIVSGPADRTKRERGDHHLCVLRTWKK